MKMKKLKKLERKSIVCSKRKKKKKQTTHRELNLAPGLTMSSLTIFTGEGEDMVFTIYGDHWRRRRRIMTLPSPTRWSEVHVLLGRMRQTM
jgi:trans-cinnamate 4-monooxygenase